MKNTITLNKVKVETCNGNQKNIHPGLKLIRQTSMPGKGLIQYSFVILFFLFTLFNGFVFCSKADPFLAGNAHNVNSNNSKMSNKIKMKIGSGTFTATLFNNETATAFKAMLPVTVTMTELNGNEKHYRFPTNLPVHASNPNDIYAGDLMVWGSNTLVLFYQSFSTSYSYTKLGRIDDSSGLARAIGSGDVTVSFESE